MSPIIPIVNDPVSSRHLLSGSRVSVLTNHLSEVYSLFESSLTCRAADRLACSSKVIQKLLRILMRKDTPLARGVIVVSARNVLVLLSCVKAWPRLSPVWSNHSRCYDRSGHEKIPRW